MTNQRHVPASKPPQVEKQLGLIMVPRGKMEEGTSDVVCRSQIPGFTFFGFCRFSRLGCDTNKARPEPSLYRDQQTEMPLLACPRTKQQTLASDPQGWWEDEQSLLCGPRDAPPVDRQCPDDRQKMAALSLQEGVNTEVLGIFHPQDAFLVWRGWNHLRFIEPI